MLKKNIIIIGGGPASMMLACSLNSAKYNISIYEKNATLGRKFLVAGKGGFNLTHSEDIAQFTERYHPKKFIEPFLNHFSNTDFRNWLKSIGIETYIGTSKRVFPIKGIKPIEVLKAIEKKLQKNQVIINLNHEWKGWSEDELLFSNNDEVKKIKSDYVVFAMGGASWKVTGSDGSWINYFNEKEITTNPFYPSNCAYQVNWSLTFIRAHHGSPLKNCEFSCGDFKQKGEAIITQFGIEGSGIYPLSFEIRKSLIENKSAKIYVDFKPDLPLEELKKRLENKGKLSIKDVLEKKINLSPAQIELLKIASTKEEYNDVVFLSGLIKSYLISIVDSAPLNAAISSVGGISLNDVTENLELKKLPNHYCIGEMLDWDAPTGGYLLQACFSTGKFLADKFNLSRYQEPNSK